MQAAHDSYADYPSSSTSNKNKSKQNEDMKGAQFVVQSNLKIMARSIAALSKISEDVFIEVSENGLFFKVFHRFKFCVFRFAPEFFNSCDLSMINKKAANVCRLSMKSAVRIFKGVTFGEKNFVGCEFRIDPNAEKMLVNLQMNYDINRIIHVKLREMSNCLQKSAYDRLLCRNKTVLFASTLIPILNQMKSDIEVTLKVDSEGITIRNFHSEHGVTMFNVSDAKSVKKVKTETTINVEKLSRHEVTVPVEFSFSLKEFLAIVTFADQLGSEVCLYYDLPGKPMVLSIEAHANFDVELALATMGNDDEVDLDGGIIKETLILQETTQSSKTSKTNRQKNNNSNDDIEIVESSSGVRRGPKQTQDGPQTGRKSIRPCFKKTISPAITPLPAREKSSTNRATPTNGHAMRSSKNQSVVNTRETNQEVQEYGEHERSAVPTVTMRAMRDVSIQEDFMDVNSMVREEHVGPDEIVEMTLEEEPREAERNDEETLFRVPEAKRNKTLDNRSKKMRRILMGTVQTETLRMSQQFSGHPLVSDTQR